MDLKCLLICLQMTAIIMARQFRLKNNCADTIWPGIQGNPSHAHLNGGGFKLGSNEEKIISSPDNWAGRFWARTHCDDSTQHCLTGDCGNKEQCNGAGGNPPTTLVEITLHGSMMQDFYDVSNVDGFNVPVSIEPVNEMFVPIKAMGNCKKVSCATNLNINCPDELKLIINKNTTIGCNSACNAFHTDQFCCAGAHDRPETCKSSDWPKDYPKYFKTGCPDAYSYAYDDHKSTFTCTGLMTTHYAITFCP